MICKLQDKKSKDWVFNSKSKNNGNLRVSNFGKLLMEKSKKLKNGKQELVGLNKKSLEERSYNITMNSLLIN
jgi:hypothetical protein